MGSDETGMDRKERNQGKAMKRSRQTIWMGAVVLLMAMASPSAADFRTGQSVQGYTGLLNTPNAFVSDIGTIDLTFSDHLEPNRRRLSDAENYLFSVGFLPFLEVGGRFTEEHPDGIRDLSANAKVHIPLSRLSPHLPHLGIGVQDMGGGSTHFQTTYGVFTQTFAPLRLSLGYGAGPDRLDGVFGGAELRVFDWLHILGEYDTEETHTGIRLMSPKGVLPLPVDLGITAKTSLDHDPGRFDIAVSMRIHLGGRDQETVTADHPAPEPTTSEAVPPPRRKPSAPIPSSRREPAEEIDSTLDHLQAVLATAGFENIDVGLSADKTIHVAYGNHRFNHNMLDGLGVAMGLTAANGPAEAKAYAFTVRRLDIPMLTVSVPADVCQAFFAPDAVSAEARSVFASGLSVSTDTGIDDPQLEHTAGDNFRSGRFKPRILLYPGLKTFLGTDLSAFDYLVSLKAEARSHLWTGALLSARLDLPVWWSENFDDDEAFETHRDDPQLDRLMVHQAFRPRSDLMTLFSVGMYTPDHYGLLNETQWRPGNGNHRFGFRLGYFEDDETQVDRDIYLGSYRYHFDFLDIDIEGIYGQYWHGDRGVTAQIRRFFGDTAISFFYRHIGTDTGERAAGIRISLPLTPRRDMAPRWFQVRGADRWTYEHQTTIAESGEANPITTDIGVIPQPSVNIDRMFYNDDRFRPEYIKDGVWRMREAYLRWGIR